MSVRSNADYVFVPLYAKFMPLNPDLSTPLPLTGNALTTLTVFGGVGPFDFSGAANTAAVPMTVKLDNGTPETQTIDVATGSGSVDESAVTATELAAAIEAANAAAGFVGVTASVDSRGYAQVDVDTVGSSKYLQVYGEAAELGEFGQGLGMQFILSNTQQSLAIDPVVKESETITITDSNGKDTEVITDQFRKGFTGVFTDTALDNLIRRLIEGGTIEDTSEAYIPPNSESPVRYFAFEVIRGIYAKGSNLETALKSYLLQRFYIATGTYGSDPGDRNFLANVYNLTGTEYKDPSTNAINSDSMNVPLTIAEYIALDWENI